MLDAVPAIPEKPNIPAMIAMTRNVSDQLNIIFFFLFRLMNVIRS
jgi:hypothetical protein